MVDVNTEEDHGTHRKGNRAVGNAKGGPCHARNALSGCGVDNQLNPKGRPLFPSCAAEFPIETARMSAPEPKRESLLLNLLFNIAAPTLILTKLSGETTLGPVWGLIVALVFPLGYFVYDFIQRRQANFISIIGFTSVLLTGGLGLMKVGPMGFAIKEAGVPLLIGIFVLISQGTKRPLVKTILLNDQVLDLPRVNAALDQRGNHAGFELLLKRANYALAGSFAISAILNFGLARYVLKSEPGTEAFNAELGKMNALSWPVISLPTMVILMVILWKLIGGIGKLTGLTTEDIFRTKEPKKS
jgi:intracellular septation protein A